jgi:hypothetical protein
MIADFKTNTAQQPLSVLLILSNLSRLGSFSGIFLHPYKGVAGADSAAIDDQTARQTEPYYLLK